MNKGGMGVETKLCPQCYKVQPLDVFVTRRGMDGRLCATCRERYANWGNKTLVEKLEGRRRVDSIPVGRILWTHRSHNRKTGPIPVSISERGTCPPTCGLYDAGCYASYGKLATHWRRVEEWGLTWGTFLSRIYALKPGTLWRHNEAGDLDANDLGINQIKLGELIFANAGRRGFTYTHRHRSLRDLSAVRWANARGFTINLSADTLEQADALYDAHAGPVTVILPETVPDSGTYTVKGRRVIVCPAQTVKMTCKECQICAHVDRKAIVGFRAHGQFKKHVPELVTLRRKAS